MRPPVLLNCNDKELIIMERFNVICPDHYPMKCNLSNVDKEHLSTKGKYKAFFVLQYKNQDDWLIPTVENYFSKKTWRLFNAGQESGTGTKFCKICRFALASDFGIISLTPLNYNVSQENGLMQGLQKPVLYLLNPDWIKNNKAELPFDIDDQIYIKHTDKESLVSGLDREIPLLIDKLKSRSGFETDKKKFIKQKAGKLSKEAIETLKCLIIDGPMECEPIISFLDPELLKYNIEDLKELSVNNFVIKKSEYRGGGEIECWTLNENYRKCLEEILWE